MHADARSLLCKATCEDFATFGICVGARCRSALLHLSPPNQCLPTTYARTLHSCSRRSFMNYLSLLYSMQELTAIKAEEEKELERLRQRELFLKYQLESLV